jgi:hypothetical protein
MSKSRHAAAQMIGALKQVGAGRKVEDVAREVEVCKADALRPAGEVRQDGCEPGAGREAVAG